MKTDCVDRVIPTQVFEISIIKALNLTRLVLLAMLTVLRKKLKGDL
jgi:hypothetical protein